MRVIKINLKKPEKEKIQQIVKALKQGKTVVIPTDTAYGLAACALDTKAVRKVFAIKKRPLNNPISVIVRDLNMAKKIAYFDNRAKRIFKKFLPGPITLVVPKKKIVPDILTSGQPKVGIRISFDKVTRAIMKKINFPITATSANISRRKVPYSKEEVLYQYKGKRKKPDLIVDAGKLPKIKPSTVVDLTSKKPKILRKGPTIINLKFKMQNVKLVVSEVEP